MRVKSLYYPESPHQRWPLYRPTTRRRCRAPLAAVRGASTLYIASDARPWARVDGEIQAFDQEPLLSANDVESLLLMITPERHHEALRSGAPVDWICELEDVGRVRCMSFRDQRGPGGVFQLMASRPASPNHLAPSLPIQPLLFEPQLLT